MPLAPLPSPSHLPGEGDSVGALVFLGSIFGIGNDAETHSIGTTASAKSPSPGRREGDGRGDRGEVSGGGRAPPYRPANEAITLVSSRGSTGLARWTWKPAARARWRSSGLAKAVTATAGRVSASRPRARISRIRS